MDLKEMRDSVAQKHGKGKLHTFDFDDTLFKPIPKVWIEETVAKARESIQDPNTVTVLITGRKDQPKRRKDLEKLLADKGLKFDAVHMNGTKLETAEYKGQKMEELQKQYPSATEIKSWENDPESLAALEE